MALTREESNKRHNAQQKESGYAAQKKYQKGYRDRMYLCRFYIEKSKKDEIQRIAKENGLSLSRLFIEAVEEKYQIKLRENA